MRPFSAVEVEHRKRDAGGAGGADTPRCGRSEFYPISARQKLFFAVNQHGNDWRFAKLFRRVWKALPSDDRTTILDHWKAQGCEQFPGVLGVRIQLESLSSMRSDRALGDCMMNATHLKFYAPVVDRLPDDLVKHVIAHELAHVIQTASGDRLAPEPHWLGPEVAYANSPIEQQANAMATGWGFPGSQLNRWLARNINWDRLPPDKY